MTLRNAKAEIVRYLQTQHLMTLATVAKKPWVSTVYFAIDKNLNFYFVSSPKSNHCKDIEKNKYIAFAIYDSHTKNSDKKSGIQGQGHATLIKSIKDMRKPLLLWNKRNPGMQNVVNMENIKSDEISSRVYKIHPTYIKYFNQKLGEDTNMEIRL